MSFNACSAISGFSAATHATRSPTNRTFVSNINASYGDGSGYPCPAVVCATRGTFLRQDNHDAGKLLRLSRVDVEDSRMRVRSPQNFRMQQPLEENVIRELRRPGN